MRRHSYLQAEKFILSREFFGMKLGLENITQYLETLGSPQKAYPTVHLAGTNGKGSTAAMLASVLRTAGYRTGLFTSPHLVDFRERIRVDGRKIAKQAVAGFVDRQRPALVKKNSRFLN
jgi:dihydrofolate synthase / folylpolyglutamate synthase